MPFFTKFHAWCQSRHTSISARWVTLHKTHTSSQQIANTAPIILRLVDSYHTMTDSAHTVADSAHAMADSAYAMADSAHAMADSAHAMADSTHCDIYTFICPKVWCNGWNATLALPNTTTGSVWQVPANASTHLSVWDSTCIIPAESCWLESHLVSGSLTCACQRLSVPLLERPTRSSQPHQTQGLRRDIYKTAVNITGLVGMDDLVDL